MLSSFYHLVIAELLILLIAIIYSTENSHSFRQTCDLTSNSSYEESMRVAATATIVPLVAEYSLDVFVSFCYPNLNEGNLLLEDRIGHGIIVLSLIPCSHLPLWIFGQATFCDLKDSLIGFSHAMIVCGVLGKLQKFASDIWSFKECVLVMSLFVIAQLSFVCGHLKSSTSTEYNELSLLITCGLKTTCLVAFISSCRNIWRLLSEKSDSLHSLFTTRKYLCSILSIGLIIFLGMCTLFCNYVVYKHQLNLEIAANRIFIQICAVLLLTVLPARFIRRGVIALENSAAIQREMALKKTFVRYVSHEVRSPLSTTSLGIDCLIDLLKTVPDTSLRQELLDLAHDCRITCSSAINTLNDLLLFDKIESNMLRIDKEKIYCKSFLQDCVRPFIRQLEIGGVSFEINFDPQIKTTYINGDLNKLEQVIRNFIGNAVKFTPTKGKISVTATVSMNEKERSDNNNSNINSPTQSQSFVQKAGMLRLAVTDTGAGISSENQKHLFQQYTQFNAAKLQGGKGSGLGLWISKAIIDMHDGKVGAYSAGEGTGSTFYFEIPCEVIPAENIAEAIPLVEQVATPIDTTASSKHHQVSHKSRKLFDPHLSPINSPSENDAGLKPEFSRTLSTVLSSYEEEKEGEGEEDKNSESSCSTQNQSKPAPAVVVEEKVETPEQSQPSNRQQTTPRSRIEFLSAKLTSTTSPRSFYVLNKNFRSVSSTFNHSPTTGGILLSSSTLDSVAGNHTKQLKILLADDTALARKMVQRLLNPLNPIIYHASNGLDAVQQIQKSLELGERPFDVVIIDYFMPCMDGAEAILHMRKSQFDGLICAVTGSTTITDQEQLLSNGASMIMSKPFNYKIFYNCLKDFYQNTDWDPYVVMPYEDT